MVYLKYLKCDIIAFFTTFTQLFKYKNIRNFNDPYLLNNLFRSILIGILDIINGILKIVTLGTVSTYLIIDFMSKSINLRYNLKKEEKTNDI